MEVGDVSDVCVVCVVMDDGDGMANGQQTRGVAAVCRCSGWAMVGRERARDAQAAPGINGPSPGIPQAAAATRTDRLHLHYTNFPRAVLSHASCVSVIGADWC